MNQGSFMLTTVRKCLQMSSTRDGAFGWIRPADFALGRAQDRDASTAARQKKQLLAVLWNRDRPPLSGPFRLLV